MKNSLKEIIVLIALVALLFSSNIYSQEKPDSTKHEQQMKKDLKGNMHEEMKMDSIMMRGMDKNMHRHMKKDSSMMHHDNKMIMKNNNYSKKQNEVTKKVWNKYCPVTGKKISPRAEILEYNGKIIGFCCAGSEHHKIFLKDPEKYMKNLSSDGQIYIAR